MSELMISDIENILASYGIMYSIEPLNVLNAKGTRFILTEPRTYTFRMPRSNTEETCVVPEPLMAQLITLKIRTNCVVRDEGCPLHRINYVLSEYYGRGSINGISYVSWEPAVRVLEDARVAVRIIHKDIAIRALHALIEGSIFGGVTDPDAIMARARSVVGQCLTENGLPNPFTGDAMSVSGFSFGQRAAWESAADAARHALDSVLPAEYATMRKRLDKLEAPERAAIDALEATRRQHLAVITQYHADFDTFVAQHAEVVAEQQRVHDEAAALLKYYSR